MPNKELLGKPPRTSRRKAVIDALVASYLTKGLTIVIGFVMTPIVLGYLGREQYGVWVIVGSLLGYFGMLDLGITGSAATLISRENQDTSGESISRIAANALAIQLVGGALIVAAGLLLARPIVVFFDLESSAGPTVGIVVTLALFAFGVRFPIQSLKATLRGTQQIARLKYLEFGVVVIRSIGILLLLSMGLGLLSLPIGALGASILTAIVLLVVVKRFVPMLELSPRLVNLKGINSIFSISLWWFLGGLGALFIYQLDNLVIGRWIGPAAVTSYALTYRLSELIREQIYQLNFSMMPGIGDLVGRGEFDKVRQVFLKAFKITVGLAVLGAGGLVMFNSLFVSIWVGPENYAGDFVTACFALFLVSSVVFHSASVVVTNHLKIARQSLVRCSEGVLNLVLSIILVRQMGIEGVALATVVAALLTSAWFVPVMAFKLLGLGIREIGVRLILPLISLAGVCAGTILVSNSIVGSGAVFDIARLITFAIAGVTGFSVLIASPLQISKLIKRG